MSTMHNTATWNKGDTSRPAVVRNVSKIIAISRPFNTSSTASKGSFCHNSVHSPDHAKFLFVSLNEDFGGVTSRSTKESTFKSPLRPPAKPQGVVSPLRFRSGKKCRILTVSSTRKSVSPKGEVSLETKLKLTQAKVMQLTKTLEEKDQEIDQLRHELLMMKSSLTKNTPINAEISKSRSISHLKIHQSAGERRGSACALQAYKPVMKKSYKGVVRRVALNSAKHEKDLLDKEVSGWRINVKNNSLKSVSVVETEKMCKREGIAEELSKIKGKVVKKLKDAFRVIERLKRFIQEHIPDSKEIMHIDSDLL